MGIIKVTGIKLRAYHGCMPEEAIVGGSYSVDVIAHCDITKAAISDDLKQTVDYVKVYEIVKQEMAIRSELLEHVAKRIHDKLKQTYTYIEKAEVSITKLNPPIPGFVEGATVVYS